MRQGARCDSTQYCPYFPTSQHHTHHPHVAGNSGSVGVALCPSPLLPLPSRCWLRQDGRHAGAPDIEQTWELHCVRRGHTWISWSLKVNCTDTGLAEKKEENAYTQNSSQTLRTARRTATPRGHWASGWTPPSMTRTYWRRRSGVGENISEDDVHTFDETIRGDHSIGPCDDELAWTLSTRRPELAPSDMLQWALRQYEHLEGSFLLVLAAATWRVAGHTGAVRELEGPQCLTRVRHMVPRVTRCCQDEPPGDTRVCVEDACGDALRTISGCIGYRFCPW